MSKVDQKIENLVQRCKGSVDITFNENTTNYETVDKYLDHQESLDLIDDLDPKIRERMVENNKIVEVHFYPNTPIGFYHVVHYDLEAALDEAIAILDAEAQS